MEGCKYCNTCNGQCCSYCEEEYNQYHNIDERIDDLKEEIAAAHLSPELLSILGDVLYDKRIKTKIIFCLNKNECCKNKQHSFKKTLF